MYTNEWDLPGAPLDYILVVTFTAEGSGTRMNLHMAFADDLAMQTAVERYGVLHGGVETFERVATYVAKLSN